MPDPGPARAAGSSDRSLDRAAILRLIPHQGASCLLDRMEHGTADSILCLATSHRNPANPLRRAGRLHALHGAEYGLQAAALHGALREPGMRGGFLAVLRDVQLFVEWLDAEPGPLLVEATLESSDTRALSYRFRIATREGAGLLHGWGMVVRETVPA